MLTAILKALFKAFPLVRFGSSGPGAIPAYRLDDSPMTRERLNELLRQTPTLPSVDNNREPVKLS